MTARYHDKKSPASSRRRAYVLSRLSHARGQDADERGLVERCVHPRLVRVVEFEDVVRHLVDRFSLHAELAEVHRDPRGFEEGVEAVYDLIGDLCVGQSLVEAEKPRAERDEPVKRSFRENLSHPARRDDRESRAVSDVEVRGKRVLDGVHRPAGISGAV